MHEMSVVESLLSVTLENAQRAAAVRVLKIYVVVGDLAGVVDEYVNLYFNFLSEKTIAAGASLVFTHMPARLKCRTCKATFSPDGSAFRCPDCNDEQVDVIGGRELYVDKLEVE
jgi:hydrogenase nickel incorporation protein HypA/HybF